MNVFIIGATGHIGSHVAKLLAEQKHVITGFVRNKQSAKKLQALGYQTHQGDIENIADLAEAALAADATVFVPQLMLEEEYNTVAALLAAYENTGKTFIFTSGTGVLGQMTDGNWSEDSFAEHDPFTPRKSIARRVDTENLVLNAANKGIRAMVARPPMIWGGGKYPAIDLLVESIRQKNAACYIGNGLNLYSHVHVDDLAALYGLMIEKGVAGALYHCVCGELSNRCLAEFVAQYCQCKTASISIDEAIDIWGKFSTLIVQAASSRSKSPRARQELGWAPRHFDLIDAIQRGDFTALQALK